MRRINQLQRQAEATGKLTRLGLVMDQVIYEHRGVYSTDEVVIRFVEELASRVFDRVQFCSRVYSSDENAPYLLDPAHFEIVQLPWYTSVPMLCAKAPLLFPRIVRSLREVLPGWKLAMPSGIHPLTPLVLRMARRRGIPCLLWIRGDLMTDLQYRLSGVRRVAGLIIAKLVLRLIPNGTPVLSIGRDDYPFLSRMGPVHVAYDSKFREQDFVPLPRPLRDSSSVPRLLYVGRIAPEKGLEILLQALDRLRQNRSVSPPNLTIVGWNYLGNSYAEEFKCRLAASSLAKSVEFAGHVPFGPKLFELYDAHDILVLPSFTEGFPQVILEAMVRGLPVIATRVGGVPRIVDNGRNGLLVEAGDAEGLFAAADRLLADPVLAAQLASEGQHSARAYALGIQVESILGFLQSCFPQAGFSDKAAHSSAAPSPLS